jgi:uncharacterized protein YqgV (UPF0045/DUF77 family)
MFLTAQVSIYPLRQTHLSPAIDKALSIFQEHGLEVMAGTMSSLVSGSDEALFAAVREAFQQTASQGDIVMNLTLSNACPIS